MNQWATTGGCCNFNYQLTARCRWVVGHVTCIQYYTWDGCARFTDASSLQPKVQRTLADIHIDYVQSWSYKSLVVCFRGETQNWPRSYILRLSIAWSYFADVIVSLYTVKGSIEGYMPPIRFLILFQVAAIHRFAREFLTRLWSCPGEQS